LTDEGTYLKLMTLDLDLSQEALGKRPDYQKIQAQIDAAEESVMVAKSQYYPEVFLEGGYLQRRESNIEQGDVWGGSINLNWSLYEGGKTNAEVAKAQAEKLRLKNLRQDLASEIRSEIFASKRLVTQRQLSVDAYLMNFQSKERYYHNALSRWREGEIMAVDLLEIKAELFMAQANYMESIHQLRTAIAWLEATSMCNLGELLEIQTVYHPDISNMKAPVALVNSSLQKANLSMDPQQEVMSSFDNKIAGDAQKNPPKKNKPFYTVQLGAFHSTENARNHLNSLKNKFPQHNLEIVSSNGWHKVQLRHLPSRETANSALKACGGKGFVLNENTDIR
ncbi:MAG: TolC family protein, partial [Deltaproteobacteria bacterium]|nr:TolC family protein [Deltaproteobacteria bacterium]